MNEGQFKVVEGLLTRIVDSLERMETNGYPTITANFVDEKGNVVKLPTRKGQPPTPPTMQAPKHRIKRS